MAYVKSGWLLRQSTILRRWKKNWFDLWSDGQLIFYGDQHRQNLEDKIHMRVDCINVHSGNECRDFQPPEGRSREFLLQIICRDERTINLCTESSDDCLAWKLALQDARINTSFLTPEMLYEDAGIATAPPFPPPYNSNLPPPPPQAYNYEQYGGAYARPPPPAFGSQVIYTSNGQPYAVAYQYPYQGPYPPPAANHVIVRNRYRDDTGDVAMGVLAGAATGMALGSLFWAF
uniref:Pleckstrin homology domain containing B2 n=1 Tax=Latimeria chalumnae TaxID=7897 RepID=H3BER3_LATCH